MKRVQKLGLLWGVAAVRKKREKFLRGYAAHICPRDVRLPCHRRFLRKDSKDPGLLNW